MDAEQLKEFRRGLRGVVETMNEVAKSAAWESADDRQRWSRELTVDLEELQVACDRLILAMAPRVKL